VRIAADVQRGAHDRECMVYQQITAHFQMRELYLVLVYMGNKLQIVVLFPINLHPFNNDLRGFANK
jgi:hypothetical protein